VFFSTLFVIELKARVRHRRTDGRTDGQARPVKWPCSYAVTSSQHRRGDARIATQLLLIQAQHNIWKQKLHA